MTSPSVSVVFHVPHSSTVVPSNVRTSLLLGDQALSNELLKMTDHYTDELFEPARAMFGGAWVRFPVSRLVLDPERFEDDLNEPMAAVGMGVIYTRTSDGLKLREEPSWEERSHLLDAYYRPHHRTLSAAVAEALTRSTKVLVIDCHSFPSEPLPYERDHSRTRPEICLGTDSYHSPPNLVDAARKAFSDQGLSVAINTPFAGALVPSAYYQIDRRVLALMIEVNRSCYMDELTGRRAPRIIECQKRMVKALNDLVGSIAE